MREGAGGSKAVMRNKALVTGQDAQRQASCTARLRRTFTPLYDSYGISTLLNSNEYDRVDVSSPGGSRSRTEEGRIERRTDKSRHQPSASRSSEAHLADVSETVHHALIGRVLLLHEAAAARKPLSSHP